MSEPLRSAAYPATVPATIPGTGARRSASKPSGPSEVAERALRAKATTTAKAARVPAQRAQRAKSTRARAKAQAREAKPVGRSSGKGAQAGAAVAAKVDPLAPDGLEAPAKRHLEIVGERSRLRVARQHRARLLLGLAATAAVVVAFGLVYLHVIAAQRQFTLDDLNTQVAQQEATYQRLRLQVAELNSPARIVAYAESKLGMIQPSSVTNLTPSATDGSATPTTTLPGQAPTGDADWPQVKPLMAGTP